MNILQNFELFIITGIYYLLFTGKTVSSCGVVQSWRTPLIQELSVHYKQD